MKKLICFLFVFGLIASASAVNVGDIDTIVNTARQLEADANDLQSFAVRLQQLRDSNFQLSILFSTETVTLTQQQKSGMLARYNNLKTQLQNDLSALP